MTTRTEYVKYSKADLERMAKFAAQMQLIGTIYRGNIGEQTTRWYDDGNGDAGIEVFTPHTPAPESLK